MSEGIRLRSLYGSDEQEPLCYLLEVDDCRILLDCGWDERFLPQTIETLQSIVEHIDVVLVSHASLSHLGALPYAVGHLGLDCPIYATLPVWRMGQMFLYDAFQNHSSRSDFKLFSLDDVDSTFDKFVKVAYSQEIQLSGRGDGITIMPFPAGHSLGGAVWKITKETDEIVYAVDINHRRERHLDSTVLESACPRPSLLITDAYNALQASRSRPEIDSELFTMTLKTLQAGGNVLMPVDSAGRVFELLLCLHQVWVKRKLDSQFTLALFSNVGYHIIEFAKSFIEWCSSSCQKEFDKSRDNPFALPELKICHTLAEFECLRLPALVLASSSFINTSFAEDVIRQWAGDERNLIFFTSKPRVPCLASDLLQQPKPDALTFECHFKVPLEGAELDEYVRSKKEERVSKEGADDDSESDDDDNDDAMNIDGPITAASAAGTAANANAANAAGAGFKRRLKLVPLYPMYNYVEPAVQSDIYGDFINFDDFKVPESMDFSAVAATHSNPSSKKVEAERLGEEETVMAVEEEEVEEIPMKAQTKLVSVSVKARVHHIDLEGRSDGTSLKTIIAHVAPRKVVLVRGTEEAKHSIRKFCEDNIPECQAVFTPANQRSILITADTNMMNVKMRDALVGALAFCKIGDYEVSYIEGQLVSSADSRHPVLQQVPERSLREHPAVFLGDVKMSDVKKSLVRAGIAATFVSGILVCENGAVNIRKASRTQLSVNGALCDAFFNIRDILYQQYQII